MSTSDSAGFSGSAESMALLGQPKRNPGQQAANAANDLAYKSGHVSQRLGVALSQCQTDGEIDRELWDDFEIHRRSANTYINQYLDCVEHVREERSAHVYEVDDFDDEAPPTDVTVRTPASSAIGLTREEWRLKISRDSLTRDLLAMHETLECLKTRAVPLPSRGALPISAFSIFAATISCILWRDSHPKQAIGVLTASGAGVACYYSSGMWNWLRTGSIERCQDELEAVLRRLSRGEVDEQNLGLRGVSFWMVDQFRK